MTTRILPSLAVAALLAVAVSLVPSRAHADDIPSNEEGTFGEKYSLFDVSGMAASGTRRGSGDLDYTRKGVSAEFTVGGYFAEDYFKTLIGLEGQFALGYQGENSFGAVPAPVVVPGQPVPITPTAPYSDADHSAYYLRVDGVFTYGLFRWNRVVRGRLVLGAGGGFEAAPRFRGGEGGEGYALLLGRLQLFPSETVGVHLTGATTVGSYRLEALINFDSWTLGGRARWLNATHTDETQERQFQLLAGYMF
ncbi:MAG: hypothetical protein ABIQ16_04275 [Polyangiaceae bacterium]